MAEFIKKITVLETGAVIADRAEIADNSFKRFKGLLGRRELLPGQALVITRCNCVHMFFMRFAIDILFCDSENRVVKICENLQPWRISPYIVRACYVVELPAGTAALHGIRISDQLSII